MFEDMTYENILESVMNRMSSNIDKRQGSVIYDAVAPACAELAEAYIKMENILDNSFADTACREYLIMRAKERGIEPYEATKSVAKGVFDGEVPLGSRFSISTVNFIVVEKICDYEYKMECETAGTEGNKYFGTLIPIDYTNSVVSGVLSEILIPARDEEDTEDFRQRYFENLYGDAFGGNKADYRKWVKAIDGVGQVKVKRASTNNSNVSVIIWGADGKAPSQELIDSVKEKLDPSESSGYGDGIAPIGHSVSVIGASVYSAIVDICITLESDGSIDYIYDTANQIISDYFDELSEDWENTESGIEVYAAQIIVRLIGIKGIKNIVSVDVEGNNYLKIPESKILKLDCATVTE